MESSFDHADAGRPFGAKAREVLAAERTAHGIVVHLSDGTHLIEVDAATPDGEGKTGQMFYIAPENYKGDFPVFAPAAGDDVPEAEDLEDDETEADPIEVPEGTIDELLEWIGEDPDRAAAARAAELGRDKPRTTLIDHIDAEFDLEDDETEANG